MSRQRPQRPGIPLGDIDPSKGGSYGSSGAYPVASSEAGTVMSDGSVVPATLEPTAETLPNVGIMGGATPAGILAGAYTGVKQFQGLKNVAKGNDMSMQQQVALALPTFGMSFAYNPVKNAFKSRTRVEEHMRDKLAEQGITVPTNPDAPHQKQWELNEKFRQSRNEADLTGADIKDGAWFYANIPDYAKLTDEQKLAAAQYQLDHGTIREHHGTIEGKMDQGYQDYITKMVSDAANKQNAALNRKERTQNRARAILSDIAPATFTEGPRYDLAPINNPYLK